jgi:hypothetical protein
MVEGASVGSGGVRRAGEEAHHEGTKGAKEEKRASRGAAENAEEEPIGLGLVNHASL